MQGLVEKYEVADLYDLKLKNIHREINIEGSPERTDFRTVFEDENGALFIIERIPPSSWDLKSRIVKTLAFLNDNGLEKIQPYVLNKKGEFISKYKDCLWQIVPYVKGVDLNRPNYIYEKWRGDVLSDFLIQLRERSNEIPFFEWSDSFSIKSYIYDLVDTIKESKTDMMDRIKPVLKFLEEDFLYISDTLSVAFCHGDFHSINMIWGENDINAVIDWEFAGYKHEIYDIANMIGCLGIENPNCLTGELVVQFLKRIKKSGIISEYSWKYLLECVVAQRFAWFSEWLRKDDVEMQEMEEEYMKVLIAKQEVLRECWSSLTPQKEHCIYV